MVDIFDPPPGPLRVIIPAAAGLAGGIVVLIAVLLLLPRGLGTTVIDPTTAPRALEVCTRAATTELGEGWTFAPPEEAWIARSAGMVMVHMIALRGYDVARARCQLRAHEGDWMVRGVWVDVPEAEEG